LKLFKCGAREKLRSVGPIVSKLKCYVGSRWTGILHTAKKNKRRLYWKHLEHEHVTEGGIEGKMERTRQQGRRRKQLLDDLTRRYWNFKG